MINNLFLDKLDTGELTEQEGLKIKAEKPSNELFCIGCNKPLDLSKVRYNKIFQCEYCGKQLVMERKSTYKPMISTDGEETEGTSYEVLTQRRSYRPVDEPKQIQPKINVRPKTELWG